MLVVIGDDAFDYILHHQDQDNTLILVILKIEVMAYGTSEFLK